MNSKFLSMLGIARKSGNALLGFDKAKDGLQSGKAKIVCVCSDISEKTLKELRYFAERENVQIIESCYDMFEFSNAVGTKTGVVAITDNGIAKRLVELADTTGM